LKLPNFVIFESKYLYNVTPMFNPLPC
jgi:hypothetical protein